jgi:aminocarboxymuconate-semialdehyde decarboxylase
MTGVELPTVDVHAHAVVPGVEALVAGHPGYLAAQDRDARWFGEAAMAVNRAQLSRVGPLLTDPERRLEAMTAARVDVQVVAPMPIYHPWADADLAERVAAVTNEGIAALAAAHPDRLVGIGTVTLQHPQLAVRQLDAAVGASGCAGCRSGRWRGSGSSTTPRSPTSGPAPRSWAHW